MSLDATVQGQEQVIQTTVTAGEARHDMTLNGAPLQGTDTIDPDAVILPNAFIAPYEALAARLRTAAVGATIVGYVPPKGTLTIGVGESTAEQIQTANRLISVRRTNVTIADASGPPLAVEVWADEVGRLLRFRVPAQNVDALREDIASVSARRVLVARPNDEPARIPGNGFSLVGTISRPGGATSKPLPAIVLVGGSGPSDRDETVAGIPIFGQLAGALADAGFLAVRYDKRGVGQSGGRPESATLADYAEDLRAVVRFTSDRKDVDRRRIAIVGHGEGGMLGLLVAAKENRVRALVLVATPGTSGAELNLWRVTHGLERSARPEDEQAHTIALQKQIHDAVLTGKGWEGVPPELRKQADVPWFGSFLAFDPARPMRDVEQPILIVHGDLDREVPPEHAGMLETLARARRSDRVVDVVRLPGVNHLLVPATTGETDEYGVLADRQVSPEVGKAIADWLTKTLASVR